MNLIRNMLVNRKEWLTYNLYWFLLPIFVWNIIFAQKLTSVGYMSQPIDLGVLGIIENILRFGTFAWPIFMVFDPKNKHFKKHLIFYIVGVTLYFTSWLIIMFMPQSALANTWLIKLAPAYTTTIWFYALGKLGQSKYYNYLSLTFVLIHTINAFSKLSG